MTSRQKPPSDDMEFERVDRIPVVLAILTKMGVQITIDEMYTPHGNRRGLSVGWLATVFLVYILAESDHRMCPVQKWVRKHHHTLEQLIEQKIRPTDFTDDRLGDVLRYLSDDALWLQIEQALGQRIIRVYDLDKMQLVRLDATVGGVNHDEKKHTLFKLGRNKEGGFEVQFKLMLGTLDPLGLPLAADVVTGNAGDDPLYVPVYRRIRETLGQVGLLYIGDCKMGAIETRAVFVHGGDLYLVPLPRTGGIPDLLAEQIDKVVAGKVKSTSIYLPQDLATDLDEDPDPELAIAEGFEITRQQKASLEDGTVVTWQERLFIIRSKTLARVQARNLDERLSKAEAELLALTPPPGRGKRRFDDPVALQQAVDAILARYKVTGLLEIEAERQVTMRHVRKYQDRPARTEKKVRYLVQVHRRQEAIDQAKQRLGWRVYATNASAERLTLTTAVLAYRDQYLIERSFSRLKGTVLAMLPLYVQRDDHAIGLIRLLTIALRAMVILEFDVRRSLAEEDDTLSGLYDGNPKRSTARPTAELILKAFDDITLAICFNPVGEIVDKSLTLLNKLQTQILNLLGLSSHIYERLTGIPVKWPVSHSKASSTTIPVG